MSDQGGPTFRPSGRATMTIETRKVMEFIDNAPPETVTKLDDSEDVAPRMLVTVLDRQNVSGTPAGRWMLKDWYVTGAVQDSNRMAKLTWRDLAQDSPYEARVEQILADAREAPDGS